MEMRSGMSPASKNARTAAVVTSVETAARQMTMMSISARSAQKTPPALKATGQELVLLVMCSLCPAIQKLPAPCRMNGSSCG